MPITNRRILIVEDEYLLAQDLQLELEHAGAVVVGPEASVAAALARIDEEAHIDAAILDVNLGGEWAFGVAETLRARQIPFVFASGYENDVMKGRFPEVRNCAKPFIVHDLMQSLEAITR